MNKQTKEANKVRGRQEERTGLPIPTIVQGVSDRTL